MYPSSTSRPALPSSQGPFQRQEECYREAEIRAAVVGARLSADAYVFQSHLEFDPPQEMLESVVEQQGNQGVTSFRAASGCKGLAGAVKRVQRTDTKKA